ncbi:BtrH N-terminal domain-containing protein [Paenibacillus sp. FJAT-26967]|uniref:BtrH N-terminal domain-containing protein n=1 Tax=Paenibacillus sp. FJAT-26967 TaxID=1729690 RepID=UPI000838EC30|nr:BtrH N-terminal domain-containing protein [Paenibacillus sp. FJAT-26967]
MVQTLHLTPNYDAQLTCEEGMIASICNWLQIDYQMLFIDSWGFHFNAPTGPEKIKLGDRISHSTLGDEKYIQCVDYMKIHHGLQIDYEVFLTLEQMLTSVRQELECSRPLAVLTDSYWCPWIPSFQKQHDDHFLIIVGVDETSGHFLCIDPMFSKKVEKLSYEFMMKGIHGYLIFTIETGIRPVWHKDWVRNISNSLLILNNPAENTDVFRAMKRLSEDILDKFDYELERGSEGLVPLIVRRFSEISKGRYKYSELVALLADLYKDDRLLYFSNGVREAGEKWGVIQQLLTKFMITGRNSTLVRISEKIADAAHFEKQLVEEFQQYISSIDSSN